MKKFINIAILFAGVASLTSCLKDKKENLDPNGSPAVVEFSTNSFGAPTETDGGYTLYSKGYPTAASVNMELTVNYAGSNPTSSDVTVNLATSQAAFDAFHTAYKIEHGIAATGTAFTVLPANLYTLPASVVIPAGQRSVKVIVPVKTASFDFTAAYILPVSITSASGTTVSKNYGTIMLNLSAQNKYDGVYSLEILATKNPNDAGSDRTNVFQDVLAKWPGNVELRTSGENIVDLYDATYNFGGGLSQWLLLLPSSATAGGGFGSARPRFTLDLATNKVTSVVNAFPNPSNGRAFALDPTYTPNAYDPATKKLDFRFIFTQPTFKPFNVVYKFTYVKAR